jgi:hypothetical protein
MYNHNPSRDFSIEHVSKRLAEKHPAYTFNYWPIEALFKSKRVEYKADEIYDGNFSDAKKNYDHEADANVPSFKTAIPPEHHIHQPEISEPPLKEYDPEIQKILLDMEAGRMMDERINNFIEDMTAILESEPNSLDLVGDFLANFLPEELAEDQLLTESPTSEIDMDDILDNDSIREDITLDILIDEILGEPETDHPPEEEQMEEPIEPIMPFY